MGGKHEELKKLEAFKAKRAGWYWKKADPPGREECEERVG